MPRPKKQDEERREYTFQIRLRADEHKAINDVAKLSTLESSTWARMILLQQAKKGLKVKD